MKTINILETEKYFRYEPSLAAGSGNERGGAPVMLFTTRRGGSSEGRYASLNMGYSTADLKENIYRNRALVLEEFGMGIDRMCSSDQVHGTVLKKISGASDDAGECDGIFTAATRVVLSMYFADCTPLFFYDPVNKAIGLSHAGWRGTAGDIASLSVEFLAREFGSRPADIIAVIGPSIGPCCFEVGPEVDREFREKLGKIRVGEFIRPAGNDKFFIDLKAVNRELLLKSGLKSPNVHTHNICTSCEKDIFYSYRRDRGETGRMAALAFID